jgi:hypothetical protein
MKHPIKAARIVHGIVTEYTENDCKILNKVARLIIKYGAISLERLQRITKYEPITIHWALWHLEAETGTAQLWILPG